MSRTFSLKQTWTALALLAVITPVLIIALWSAGLMYKNNLDSALMVERRSNEALRNSIQYRYQHIVDVLKSKSRTLEPYLKTSLDNGSKQELTIILRDIVRHEKGIRETMIMSRDGRVIAAVDPGFGLDGNTIPGELKLQAVAKHWGFDQPDKRPELVVALFGRLYTGSPHKHEDFYAFHISVPIGKPTNYVLVSTIDVGRLWTPNEHLHGSGSDKTSNYILDRRGSLISKVNSASYRRGDLMTHLRITRAALTNDKWSDAKPYNGINGKPVFGTMTIIPSLDWTLVSEVLASVLTTPIWQSLLKILLISLAVIVVFVWAVIYMANRALKPVQEVSRAIDKVTAGDFSAEVVPRGFSELRSMASGFNTMVKARKQAEQLLLEREQDLAITLDNIADGVITIDEHGVILTFSKNAEAIFGYAANDVIGQDGSRLIPEINAAVQIANQPDTESNVASFFDSDLVGKRRDGTTFTLRLAIAELPATNHAHRRFIGSCQDVTRNQLQEEQLRRAEKMDALGKLTGGIAHDYNNMLGVILGFIELINYSKPDNEKLADYLNQIEHAAMRGAQLTKKLLAFSRPEDGQKSIVDVNSMLLDEQHMLEKTLTARITLDMDLSDELWPIWLDSSELEDTILNICINAMHAISGNGKLTIQTRNEHLGNKEAKLLQIKPGEYVALTLTDTGCGMDASTREKIFDPFFTTKGKNGTGLGLSQVYGFIERCGGTIKVISQPGKGTSFILYFPRDVVHSEPVQPTREATPGAHWRGHETILVVDDETALLNLANVILSDNGYRVICAENARQALLLLEKESVDLLLSDVVMPEMNGYQLAGIIQKKYPDVRIQLASGYAGEEKADYVDEELEQNLLSKPYKSEVLLEKIRALLDARTECKAPLSSN